MAIGIGGAGSKLAAKLDENAVVYNVSEAELKKVGAKNSVVATLHAEHGQYRGARKDPSIGLEAFQTIRRELCQKSHGNMVFSSTGGGTGSGITSALLQSIADNAQSIPMEMRTSFVLVLPYPRLESTEYVNNTTAFLSGPLSKAVDSGNTGNIMLFSNHVKFEQRIAEDDYNNKIVESLKVFLAIPEKNEVLKLLDGHIDAEDFADYLAKPYFNHFTYFDYDANRDFGEQLQENYNELLLSPENPIEAMFMLEVPVGASPTIFYNILEYFNYLKVTPTYSVVENPELEKPLVTVSLLYRRKPEELVADFSNIANMYAREKARKAVEQHNHLNPKTINIEEEIQGVVTTQGGNLEVLDILKRLGKI